MMGREAETTQKRSPFYTELCSLLGIQHPIIQGALGGVAGPALAAAVSNAGGLGVLPTWGLSLEDLRRSIRQTRELTRRPFAVNIVPISPGFARTRGEVVVEEGVGIITTGRADPRQPIVAFLKAHGVKVIGVVPTVRHALRLEAEGADAVVASGSEAGGHVGRISTLALVPQVVDAVKIPVVAAGGIADARGFVAALALGACGIQMGTRFVATVESEASPQEKQRVLEAGDEDSVVTDIFTGKTTRVLRSAQLDRVLRSLEAGTPWEELRPQIIDLRRKKDAKDPGFTSIASGQGAGLIKRITTAEEVIQEIISGAEALWRRLGLSFPLVSCDRIGGSGAIHPEKGGP